MTAHAQLERRDRALLDSSLDRVVAVDGAGYIVEFNAVAARQLGCPREEALGRDVGLLFAAGEADARVRRRLEAGNPVTAEVRIRRRDGALVYASSSAAPVRDDDGAARRLGGRLPRDDGRAARPGRPQVSLALQRLSCGSVPPHGVDTRPPPAA